MTKRQLLGFVFGWVCFILILSYAFVWGLPKPKVVQSILINTINSNKDTNVAVNAQLGNWTISSIIPFDTVADRELESQSNSHIELRSAVIDVRPIVSKRSDSDISIDAPFLRILFEIDRWTVESNNSVSMTAHCSYRINIQTDSDTHSLIPLKFDQSWQLNTTTYSVFFRRCPEIDWSLYQKSLRWVVYVCGRVTLPLEMESDFAKQIAALNLKSAIVDLSKYNISVHLINVDFSAQIIDKTQTKHLFGIHYNGDAATMANQLLRDAPYRNTVKYAVKEIDYLLNYSINDITVSDDKKGVPMNEISLNDLFKPLKNPILYSPPNRIAVCVTILFKETPALEYWIQNTLNSIIDDIHIFVDWYTITQNTAAILRKYLALINVDNNSNKRIYLWDWLFTVPLSDGTLSKKPTVFYGQMQAIEQFNFYATYQYKWVFYLDSDDFLGQSLAISNADMRNTLFNDYWSQSTVSHIKLQWIEYDACCAFFDLAKNSQNGFNLSATVATLRRIGRQASKHADIPLRTVFGGVHISWGWFEFPFVESSKSNNNHNIGQLSLDLNFMATYHLRCRPKFLSIITNISRRLECAQTWDIAISNDYFNSAVLKLNYTQL